MANARLLLLAAVLAGLLVAPAPASAGVNYPAVGFGEQQPGVFANPWGQEPGLKRIRYVVGWDVLRSRWQTRELDAWMTAARVAGAQPLIAFTRSRTPSRVRVLPSGRTYRRAFEAFRERYPDVTDFIAWNEVNHCSQPLCHKPRVAARYFDAMRSACHHCTVVAADLLDTPSMVWYLKRFVKAVKHKPRIWGLHNY